MSFMLQCQPTGSSEWADTVLSKTSSIDGLPGGEYATRDAADAALQRRAEIFGDPKTQYRVVDRSPQTTKSVLTTDKKVRKEQPIARGVLGYFPRAMAAVANVSFVGNEQHNPGEPMHWAKGKSNDHADCIVRHLIEAGTVDEDGLRHTAKAAWRALALLETELESLETK